MHKKIEPVQLRIEDTLVLLVAFDRHTDIDLLAETVADQSYPKVGILGRLSDGPVISFIRRLQNRKIDVESHQHETSVACGAYKDGNTLLMARLDPFGFLLALKAIGITYSGIEADIHAFDQEEREPPTRNGKFLQDGWNSIPHASLADIDLSLAIGSLFKGFALRIKDQHAGMTVASPTLVS
ncbi:hypothetical protein HYV73_00375 [Candidatus Uhrbacteria bacterium]|nr:hypothetical protein [Candidatus Uhrbacteria bacterium]